MRSITHISIVCIAVAAAMEGCIKSTPDPVMPVEQETVRFTLDAPGLANYSRAMTEPVENEIASADVLVFESATDGNGGLITHRGATLISGTTFEVELPAGNRDLMIVANAPEAVDGLVPRTPKTDVIDRMSVWQTGKWSYLDPIPMWGEIDNVSIDASTLLRADMHRMLTRIDVLLADAVTNFELREIWLANPNTAGLVAPRYLDPAVWDPNGGTVNPGKGIAIAPSLPANPGRQSGPAQLFTSADGIEPRAAVRAIYTFEAANGNEQTRAQNPCLVVGGSYAGSAQTTWYRVDFAITDDSGELEYLPLLRNHNYVITVKSVSGPGFLSPEDALDAFSSSIVIGLQEWQDGGLGEVHL